MRENTEKLNKVELSLIKIGVDIARKGEGALFVVGDHVAYRELLKQKFIPFNMFDEGSRKVLISLATIDGAVLLNKKGIVYGCGAMIYTKRSFSGYGTRHAAACSASLEGKATAILVSEEEKKVKVFKRGELFLQVDALDKHVKENIGEINRVLQSIGFASVPSLLSTAGIISFTLPIASSILIFGVPYYIFKRYLEVRS